MRTSGRSKWGGWRCWGSRTPRSLGIIGVREEDIDRLAGFALRDACMATNPRPVTHADVAALFRQAL